jgi:hypothetical protein
MTDECRAFLYLSSFSVRRFSDPRARAMRLICSGEINSDISVPGRRWEIYPRVSKEERGIPPIIYELREARRARALARARTRTREYLKFL